MSKVSLLSVLILGLAQAKPGYDQSVFCCKVPEGLEVLGYDHSSVQGLKNFDQGYVDYGGIIVVDCGSSPYAEHSTLDGLKAFKCNADTQAEFESLTCESPGASCDLKDVIIFFKELLAVGHAEQSCRDKGSFLSSIKTWDENAAAVWLMKQGGSTGGFIGLTDRVTENDFQWMDGSGFNLYRDFSKWFYSHADSQPNDSGYLAIGEDYVIIDLKESDGYWFDVGPPRVNNPLVPGDRLGYFCKIPTLVLETEVVVEPTKPACGWSNWSPWTACWPGAEVKRSTRRCSCAGAFTPRTLGVLTGSGCEGSSYRMERCSDSGDEDYDDSDGTYDDEDGGYSGGEDSDDSAGTYDDEDGGYSGGEDSDDSDGTYDDEDGGYSGGDDSGGDADDDYSDGGISGNGNEVDEYGNGVEDDMCDWAEWSAYSACNRFARFRRSIRKCVCPSHTGNGAVPRGAGFTSADNPCEGLSYRVDSNCGEPVVVINAPSPRCSWSDFEAITPCHSGRMLLYRRCACTDSGGATECERGQSETEYRDCN